MSARTKRQRQARALRRRVERAEARVAVLEAAQRKRKKSAGRIEVTIDGRTAASGPVDAPVGVAASGVLGQADAVEHLVDAVDLVGEAPHEVDEVLKAAADGPSMLGVAADLDSRELLAERNRQRAERRRQVAVAQERRRNCPIHGQGGHAGQGGGVVHRDDPRSSVASTSLTASTTSPSAATEEAPEGTRVAGSGGPATPYRSNTRSGDAVPGESTAELGPLALLREYRSEIFGAVWPPLLVLLIFAIPLVVGIFLGWWAS